MSPPGGGSGAKQTDQDLKEPPSRTCRDQKVVQVDQPGEGLSCSSPPGFFPSQSEQ